MNADRPDDRAMMEVALGEARASLEAGGVPVGAALADGGRLVASGHNERVQLGDPIAHGEIACLRNAGKAVLLPGHDDVHHAFPVPDVLGRDPAVPDTAGGGR